jgi:transposase
MSQAYISGVERTFPNANIVFDKFHIIQHINKAMNTVRRDERRGNDALKGHWKGILEYFNSRITNGILEGINSKIQLAKRGHTSIKI